MIDIGGNLLRARAEEVDRLARALHDEPFVGITGEPETGKTRLVARAVAMLQRTDVAVATIDLWGAFSRPRLGRLWLRAVALASAGPIAFSHMAALPESMWPGTTRRAAIEVRRLLGNLTDAALSETPRPTDSAEDHLDAALDASVRLAQRRPAIFVLEHLEAPQLPPRSAFKLDDLLWAIRARAQQEPSLHIAVVTNPELVRSLTGSRAAFFGYGEWLTVAAPPRDAWYWALEEAPPSVRESIDEVLEITHGHIPSAVAVFHELLAGRAEGASSAFVTLAARNVSHAHRTLRHAASVNRLGPHVLQAVADQRGPYEATPDARTRDIARCVSDLRLAGLITQPASRTWRLLDPFVEATLRSAPSIAGDQPGGEVDRR
jgi:hypothetical protein